MSTLDEIVEIVLLAVMLILITMSLMFLDTKTTKIAIKGIPSETTRIPVTMNNI